MMVLSSWDQLKKASDEVKGRFNLKDCETHQLLMDMLHVDVHAVASKLSPVCWLVVVMVVVTVVAITWIRWSSFSGLWECGKFTVFCVCFFVVF